MRTKRRPTTAEHDEPTTELTSQLPGPSSLPSAERIQQALATATSIDNFFGKEGIFACLFASTLEQMLEAELTAQLGYERYAAVRPFKPYFRRRISSAA